MKEQGVEKPIKWSIDPLDVWAKEDRSESRASLIVTIGATMFSPRILNFGLIEHVFSTSASFLYTCIRGLYGQYWYGKRHKLEAEGLFEDRELGGQAFKFVYQGKRPLGDLVKGGNFYYLRFGRISGPEATATDAFDAWLVECREAMSKHDFKAVGIEIPEESPSTIQMALDGFDHVAKWQFFRGKVWGIAERERLVAFLTPDQFEQFSCSPQSAFLRGLGLLDKPLIERYFLLAKNMSEPDERANAKQLLENELLEEMERQIDISAAATSVIFGRDADFNPQRQRVHETTFIRKREDELFVEVLKNGTGVEYIPLQRFVDAKSAGLCLKTAYKLYRILQKTPIEELTRERILNREEIIPALIKDGVKIEAPNGYYTSFVHVISSRREWIRYLRRRATGFVSPALTVLSICLATQPFLTLAQNAFSIDRLMTNSTVSSESDREPIAFPEGLLPHQLDWKVQRFGDINPFGYYALKTSSTLDQTRGWTVNKDRKERLLLPPFMDEAIPHITLSKRVGLNLNGETTFRIPIKNGTGLAALRLTDRAGNLVSANVSQLTDGTIEVMVSRTLLEDQTAWVDILAYLIGSDTNAVRAAGEISPLDENKLDPWLLKLLRSFEAYTSNGVITEFVKNRHLYSLDPTGKNMLSRVKNSEELVNAIDLLEGCTCEICNTQSVLLSTIDGDNTLNIAFGYLHGYFNLASQGSSFLLTETYHAYGIDSNGRIFDSTPAAPAEDELTKKYFESKTEDENSRRGSQEEEWITLQREIAKQSQTPQDFIHSLKILGLFLSSVIGLSLAKKGALFVKNKATADNIRSIGDMAFQHLFSRDDLTIAYNFFSWVSWSRENHPLGKHTFDQEMSKGEILQMVRSVTNKEALADFIFNPGNLAEQTGLSLLQGAKIRLLARYIDVL